MENKTDVVLGSLFVTIRNRQKIVFDDEVKGMTSINDIGIFDILPQHESFICMVKERLVLYKKDNSQQEMKIVKGILKAYKNNVQVYLV